MRKHFGPGKFEVKKKVSIMAFSTFIATAPVGVAIGAELQGLGDLLGGAFESRAFGISNDGSIVVGTGTSTNGVEAFRWTQSTGMQGLGDLPGGSFESEAIAVSGDGSVIVGVSSSFIGTEAFRWTQSTGMQGLGDLPGGADFSRARAVSGDGSVIVGVSLSGSGGEAFRWTQSTGMQGLGDLPGGIIFSSAHGVSGDGSVIVGQAGSDNGSEAFRWTQSTGMQGLGDLTGGVFWSVAYNVSDNGTVIVGQSTSASGDQAFRWTQSTGMQGLGDLPGGSFESEAIAVSGGGSVIVGQSNSASGDEAFYWTQGTGMVPLEQALIDAGVDTSNWSRLVLAEDVSPDGNIIVGAGASSTGNTEAFLANVQAGGLLNMNDFAQSIDELHITNELATHNARNLVQFSVPYDSPGLSIAPVYTYVDGSSISSAGITVNYGHETFNLKGRAGITKAEDDLRYGGETDFDGYWLGLGINSNMGAITGVEQLKALELTANVVAGDYNADVARQYLNGADVETSSGDTDLNTISALARVGWKLPLQETFSITPYGQVLYTTTEIDAYEETGGTFPGSVDEQDTDNTEYSLGTKLDWKTSDSLKVFARAAWVYLQDENGEIIQIDVPNAGGAYSSSEPTFDQNWAEYGVGATYAFTETISFSAEVGGTAGSDYPENMYGSVSCNISF